MVGSLPTRAVGAGPRSGWGRRVLAHAPRARGPGLEVRFIGPLGVHAPPRARAGLLALWRSAPDGTRPRHPCQPLADPGRHYPRRTSERGERYWGRKPPIGVGKSPTPMTCCLPRRWPAPARGGAVGATASARRRPAAPGAATDNAVASASEAPPPAPRGPRAPGPRKPAGRRRATRGRPPRFPRPAT